MRFEWDPEKDRANHLKHGLSFDEASRLFTEDEDRFIAIGLIGRRVIVVAYAERQDDVIRIFSARTATAKERRQLDEFWRGGNER